MPLFFSRRRFKSNRFNNAASDAARHIDITYADAFSGRWAGSFTDRSTWVDRALARSRNGQVLIYVHGYNTDQRGMVTNLRKIETGLGAPFAGTVVGFDWPSDGSAIAYNWDSRDIAKVASSLTEDAVVPLLNHSRCKGVSILAHSRGTFLTLRALMEDRALGGAKKIDNIAFIAADLRSLDVKPHTKARKHLHRTTRRFSNYYSTRDVILGLSRFVNGTQPRLGATGLQNPAEPPHSDIRCTEQYVHEHGEGYRPRLSHSWYFSSQGFYRDLAMTLAGKPANALPTRKRIANSTDHVLWVR